ncbi:hypothetical protein [Pontibacter sp. G13]|uniref:hypothetical protein n=1 Tax=Pontibacter sp. G13 TaxID=3074898 RepID=UPI00288B658D|nr:hypothetical protein [Pontibacter sp. G13]WNJ18869.1 hypothetical protein RJD25_00100 [Pontibacter sp. G13]
MNTTYSSYVSGLSDLGLLELIRYPEAHSARVVEAAEMEWQDRNLSPQEIRKVEASLEARHWARERQYRRLRAKEASRMRLWDRMSFSMEPKDWMGSYGAVRLVAMILLIVGLILFTNGIEDMGLIFSAKQDFLGWMVIHGIPVLFFWSLAFGCWGFFSAGWRLGMMASSFSAGFYVPLVVIKLTGSLGGESISVMSLPKLVRGIMGGTSDTFYLSLVLAIVLMAWVFFSRKAILRQFGIHPAEIRRFSLAGILSSVVVWVLMTL